MYEKMQDDLEKLEGSVSASATSAVSGMYPGQKLPNLDADSEELALIVEEAPKDENGAESENEDGLHENLMTEDDLEVYSIPDDELVLAEISSETVAEVSSESVAEATVADEPVNTAQVSTSTATDTDARLSALEAQLAQTNEMNKQLLNLLQLQMSTK